MWMPLADDNRNCSMWITWGGSQVNSVCAETLRRCGFTDAQSGKRSFAALALNVRHAH